MNTAIYRYLDPPPGEKLKFRSALRGVPGVLAELLLEMLPVSTNNDTRLPPFKEEVDADEHL